MLDFNFRKTTFPASIWRGIDVCFYWKACTDAVSRHDGLILGTGYCCGQIGDIANDLLDLEINIYWPQIKLYENKIDWVKRSRNEHVTLLIHQDQQNLIPLGTPAKIDATVRKYTDIYHELGGGGIFILKLKMTHHGKTLRLWLRRYTCIGNSVHKWPGILWTLPKHSWAAVFSSIIAIKHNVKFHMRHDSKADSDGDICLRIR